MVSGDSEPSEKPAPPPGPEVDPSEGILDQATMLLEVKLRHGLEDQYACDTHLPLICYIPTQTPLISWRHLAASFQGLQHDKRYKWK